MSRAYVDQCIKEALKMAQGNRAKARQHLIAKAMNDQILLKALVSPHMNGIAAHAISHLINRETKDGADTQPAPQSTQEQDNSFGMEILKSIAGGDAAVFGHDNGRPPRRIAASQQHIDAIKKMARKSDDSSSF